MHRRLSFLIVLLTIGFPCFAQYSDPEALVKAFFQPQGIKDKKSAYVDEMLSHLNDPTLGDYLAKETKKEYRLLASYPDSCVFAVAVEQKGDVTDWYIFLKKSDTGWRIAAVRSLALTEMIRVMVGMLKVKENRTAEEERYFRQGQLIISSDAQLKSNLRQNLEKFENLVEALKKSDPGTDEKAKELFLSSVKQLENGSVEFMIGGMVDNFVGYLYIPDGVPPPVMTSDELIYLEKIIGNWYLFKTT